MTNLQLSMEILYIYDSMFLDTTVWFLVKQKLVFFIVLLIFSSVPCTLISLLRVL